jgi:hypothetical protein
MRSSDYWSRCRLPTPTSPLGGASGAQPLGDPFIGYMLRKSIRAQQKEVPLL